MGCRSVRMAMLATSLAWMTSAVPALAQHDMPMGGESGVTKPGVTPELPKYVADPIPIYTVGLGPFTKTITTRNPEAQALFTQGMQMMYSFAKLDAVRSFRAAWQRDASPQPHEAHTLRLDSAKAHARLGWQPRWNLQRALEATLDWHQAWKAGTDMADFSLRQIRAYEATE